MLPLPRNYKAPLCRVFVGHEDHRLGGGYHAAFFRLCVLLLEPMGVMIRGCVAGDVVRRC